MEIKIGEVKIIKFINDYLYLYNLKVHLVSEQDQDSDLPYCVRLCSEARGAIRVVEKFINSLEFFDKFGRSHSVFDDEATDSEFFETIKKLKSDCSVAFEELSEIKLLEFKVYK